MVMTEGEGRWGRDWLLPDGGSRLLLYSLLLLLANLIPYTYDFVKKAIGLMSKTVVWHQSRDSSVRDPRGRFYRR